MRLPVALLALAVTACMKPSPAEQARRDTDRRFLEAAALQPGALRLASGVVFQSMQDGTGATPKPRDHVMVRYTGRLTDGRIFDASERHGGALDMGLDASIPCWKDGVAQMKVGGKATLTCPPETGYGDRGIEGTIPGGAVLRFEIELVAITASVH
jgi:FKBP-type peptidyl-prolyl cis-trans isomerase FkpA